MTSFEHETRNGKSHLWEEHVCQTTAPNSGCGKIRPHQNLRQSENTLAVLVFWREQHTQREINVICKELGNITVEDETTSKPFIIVGWNLQRGLEKNWDWQNANESLNNKSSCGISSADVLQN